ncbi:hypothetical protein CRE_26855 [Caenorhabditis remanei]|uniref:Galactosylgalactosylxylosylprotein 3-beta-glucuronosyltransferase n=1 Tax=Caenorhabditis remanei TaxID=31234 RepID=E3NM26_CAERE|nr:hypothetical protein CRE_26855 [Caenorhabditis remanei]
MDQTSFGRDCESAYGSEVSSNATFKLQKDRFQIEESTTKKEIWYEWIRNRLRHYMILELLFSICLVLILWKQYHISSQSDKTLELISSIQSEFRNFKIDIESDRASKPTDTMNLDVGNEKLEEFVEEGMKDMKNPSIERNQKSKEYPKQVIPTQENSSPNNSVFQINAASLVLGATVDSSRSSSSDNNPLFGRDQSGYVLIDRSDPPSDKAWCSNEENPILTIDLAKYIRPISVSYQHSKWSGMVPDGAPSRYDVLACLDYYCNTLEPLVSNCEYRATRDNKQEQFCSIPLNRNHSSIGKVQFHFRQNHGNVMKTCAHSIRVYGETKEVPKVNERTLKQAETCSKLTYDYHHKSWTYNIVCVLNIKSYNYFNYFQIDYKNCTVLYSNDCCNECPECCDECVIKDINSETVFFCVFFIIISPFIIGPILFFIALIIDYLLSVIKASRLRGPYIPDYYYSCAPNPYYWRFGIHTLDEKTINDFKTRKLQFVEFNSEEKEEMIINSIPYNPLLDDIIHDPIFREQTFNFSENFFQTILFMEWNQHKHKYAENETFQMVEYKMRTFVSFYVFLPKIRFGLQNALKNLYHLINTANEKYVDIRVPRFKIDTEADLGSFSNSIGIEKGLYEDVSNKVLGKTPRFVHKVQFENSMLDISLSRTFAVDMAGFAVNLRVVMNSTAVFGLHCKERYAPETCLLEDMGLERKDIEPFGWEGEKDREILVWHTKTSTPNFPKAEKNATKPAPPPETYGYFVEV